MSPAYRGYPTGSQLLTTRPKVLLYFGVRNIHCTLALTW